MKSNQKSHKTKLRPVTVRVLLGRMVREEASVVVRVPSLTAADQCLTEVYDAVGDDVSWEPDNEWGCEEGTHAVVGECTDQPECEVLTTGRGYRVRRCGPSMTRDDLALEIVRFRQLLDTAAAAGLLQGMEGDAGRILYDTVKTAEVVTTDSLVPGVVDGLDSSEKADLDAQLRKFSPPLEDADGGQTADRGGA